MQSTAGGSANIVVPGKAGTGAAQRSSVNTPSFWNLKAEQVAAEDVFFHEYFSQIGKPAQAAKKQARKEADEGASEEDEEAEGEIWDALVNSRPEVGGGDEDDDDDMDLARLDEDYGSDVSLNLGDDDEDMSDGGGAGLGSDAGWGRRRV